MLQPMLANTIYECFTHLAREDVVGHTFIGSKGTQTRSFAQTIRSAARVHGALVAQGLSRGDRVALMIQDDAHFIACFLGAVHGGFVPVPVAPPALTGTGSVERIVGILTASRAALLIASPRYLEPLRPLLARTPTLRAIVSDAAVVSMARPAPAPAPAAADDLCCLQFTSGSTGVPKGVAVRHRNLGANARLILADTLHARRDDHVLSWLPLYHDMGLIGMVLAPLFFALPVTFIPTNRFVRSPGVWLETMAARGATISFAPNFAYALAAKRCGDTRHLDLSRVRVLGCGAEPISAQVLDMFQRTYAPAGLRAGALLPCYGMAEATLAITFAKLGQPITTLAIDRGAYELQRRIVPATADSPTKRQVLTSCGRTAPGHRVDIVDEHGVALPPDRVGEITFSGPSVTGEYFDNPAASRVTFSAGRLHTGDLGFVHAGDLYVCGRKKDLIIVNGRNYYPQDIEWAVGELPGVRPGGVAAFGVDTDETERLVVVAEVRGADASSAQAIASAVERHAGVTPALVARVAPGAIPKTTSGKVQRSLTKQRLLRGELPPAADSGMQRTAPRPTSM